MNADPKVMEYFPFKLTTKETASYIDRLKTQYKKTGYTYFAVDTLDTEEFIGFIGINDQNYEAPFNPSVDIGWRLKKSAWGRGYATE
ncbi:GNAT family N-acetyltransferase [Aquimarina agarivorans]|uniref:GNAT family N-acetyltransferase n=1 Tax=Aquimarina agarivorans TaxID=980584 RepID=UPI000248F907|nr:GNAT family N-acetyltransferase [Aquimarina agarivorans]